MALWARKEGGQGDSGRSREVTGGGGNLNGDFLGFSNVSMLSFSAIASESIVKMRTDT